jgi:hypothetical protein
VGGGCRGWGGGGGVGVCGWMDGGGGGGCRGAGVQGCTGAGVQGCRGAGVQGCRGAGVQGTGSYRRTCRGLRCSMETAAGPPSSLARSASTGLSPFFLGTNWRTAQRSGYAA